MCVWSQSEQHRHTFCKPVYLIAEHPRLALHGKIGDARCLGDQVFGRALREARRVVRLPPFRFGRTLKRRKRQNLYRDRLHNCHFTVGDGREQSGEDCRRKYP